MTKINLFDIESIKNCIRKACVQSINEELSNLGHTDVYEVQQRQTCEAERLIALIDSLNEVKNDTVS